jgi:predicted metal-dependent RNase
MGTAFDANERKKNKALSKVTTSEKEKKSNSTGKKVASRKKAPVEKANIPVKAQKKRTSSPKKSNKEFIPIERETENNSVSLETKTVKTQAKKSKAKKGKVKVLFLGGVGEIGKNMTAIEYGNDIIVVDAGLTFPNAEDMPGIDSVVPDVSYLAQNRDKIRAVLLTHGHEDHIGGVPYLMKELHPDTPIYATKLTLMLKEKGIDLDTSVYTVQEAFENIIKLYK